MLLGVDVGGTFTDAALYDGRGVHTAKVPTTPDDQSVGVLAATAAVLGEVGARPDEVEAFAHGMTVGTNALLQESGAKTAFVTTAGFGDLLEIGRQRRPHLYRLCAPKPRPLVPAALRFEAAERVAPAGVLEPLDEDEPQRLADALRAAGAESVAICLLFSYLDPSHERRLAERLRELLPEVHVSASHEVLPQFREYERASTTVIDAYLSPAIANYLGGLSRAAVGRGLPEPAIIKSSGGVAPVAEAARAGAQTVLSGPAGGAVGVGMLAVLYGEGDVIGLDMGGTSCDVCVVEGGRVRQTDSREIDGRVIQLPMVDVHTVGAGGGSIAWRDDGGALRVGPRSAGAEPGPACYRRGGTAPTVTDANLVAGYLGASSQLAGGVGLDAGAAERAVSGLARELGIDPVATADGIIRVANQEMVRALRVVTVERGIDPRRFALLPFGGAGPMHAAALAEELGLERILCPRASGVLSALGLLASDRRRDTARTVMLDCANLTAASLAARVAALREAIGTGLEAAAAEVTFELRYHGQAFELAVAGSEAPDPDELVEAFEAQHERRYGYREPAGRVELVNVRLALVEAGPRPRPEPARAGAVERSTRPALFGGRWIDAEVIRGEPGEGERAAGPCIFELPETTLVLPAGWEGEVDRYGTLVATQRGRLGVTTLDPVTVQVLTGGLRAACEEMGAILVRASYSANIKERRDCSTALFDAGGELVMQAEHIPVHLGSMPDAVAAVFGEAHRPGDQWILNDPYRGGTHLPDITLVSPLFDRDGERLIGFAASRAHHADVGGPTPGGMPADSTRLADEGVVIPPTRADDDTLRELAHSMRRPEERLADLRAQRAANLLGERRARELAERLGSAGFAAGLATVLEYAERRARARIAAIPDGTYAAEDVLEGGPDGSVDVALRVTASVEGEHLRLDFAGTAAQVEGNLNCPLPVTKSAAFFAVRALTDPDAPPSAGSCRPIEVVAPPGSLLNARPPAAVAAGNVETSSRVADLVIAALAGAVPAPAQGQGTMNNLTVAGVGWSYYETIGGGQGACPQADGPSAIHVAMSNTLNTPVEALETEYPLRVRELSVRRASGGAGRQRGGDGIVREIEALAPARFSLITERRRHAPRGSNGGADGTCGRNLLNGSELPSKAAGVLSPGDRLRIETPGGGGYGPGGSTAQKLTQEERENT